jgi:hypothetical protein
MEARPVGPGALPPQLAQAVTQASREGLKRFRDEAEDPEAVARLDAQIADIEAARAGAKDPEQSEARAFNE